LGIGDKTLQILNEYAFLLSYPLEDKNLTADCIQIDPTLFPSKNEAVSKISLNADNADNADAR